MLDFAYANDLTSDHFTRLDGGFGTDGNVHILRTGTGAEDSETVAGTFTAAAESSATAVVVIHGHVAADDTMAIRLRPRRHRVDRRRHNHNGLLIAIATTFIVQRRHFDLI